MDITVNEKPMDVCSNEEEDTEEEDMYVYVNLGDNIKKEDLMLYENLKIVGIETDRPIACVDKLVYTGEYKDSFETLAFFEKNSSSTEEPLKYFAKTQKVLELKQIFIKPKQQSEDTDGCK